MVAHVEAEGGAQSADLADAAVFDEGADHAPLRVAAVHEAFHEKDAGAVRRLQNGSAFGLVQGGGLFAQDVLARPGGADAPFRVHVVGEGDVHHVHFRILQQGLVTRMGPGNAHLGGEQFRAGSVAARRGRNGNAVGLEIAREFARYAARAQHAPAQARGGLRVFVHSRGSPVPMFRFSKGGK